MDKTYLQSFLDDNEQLAIQQFWGSEVMREAVKKVLLAGLHQNGTLKKREAPNARYNMAFGAAAQGTYSNEELGADLRANWAGLNAIELAFNALGVFQPEPPKVVTKNPAR